MNKLAIRTIYKIHRKTTLILIITIAIVHNAQFSDLKVVFSKSDIRSKIHHWEHTTFLSHLPSKNEGLLQRPSPSSWLPSHGSKNTTKSRPSLQQKQINNDKWKKWMVTKIGAVIVLWLVIDDCLLQKYGRFIVISNIQSKSSTDLK